MKIAFQKLNNGARLPKPATPGSAGVDLSSTENMWIPPNTVTKIPTGLKVAIPPGHVGLIRPRSSTFRAGITIEGVIDSDYRGELFMLATPLGHEECFVPSGERIAQLVVVPCLTTVEEVDQLSPTLRDAGGFGSTGR